MRRSVARGWLVGVVLACATASPFTAGDRSAAVVRGRPLVWHDEFSGADGAPPSARRWNHQVGGQGWGNRELQCYTSDPRNARTNGRGQLIITARREPTSCPGSFNAYSSARLTTQHLFTAKYGRIEMRARMPGGVGTWPAFWALGADIDTVGWPRSGEIDVVEYLPRQPMELSGTVHGPTATGARYYLHRGHTADVDLSKAFHRYAAEWTPDRIVFYLDGVRYGVVNRSTASTRGRWVADHPYYLLLNLAVGGTLGGQVPSTTTWPQHYAIDYVRVYR